MPFIKNILQYKSVSIVGMAKNTGKTTCLNYVLNRLEKNNRKVALTSIGVDGEERDILYDTIKPRIRLKKGNYFITSEKHFAEKELDAKVISVSHRTTALGKLITAEATNDGNVILSGPSDTLWLQECIDSLLKLGTDITLVDGALSRMSLASPAVTDAMILCTGAACSAQLHKIIDKTKFCCTLINLEQVNNNMQKQLFPVENDIWQWNKASAEWQKIGNSVFTIENLVGCTDKIYVSGAVTNRFLRMLCLKKNGRVQLIVRDFTKLFIEPATFYKFVELGGSIKVLKKTKLLAVCTNPVSPEGVRLNPEMLRGKMQEVLQMPVYDVMEIVNNERGN